MACSANPTTFFALVPIKLGFMSLVLPEFAK